MNRRENLSNVDHYVRGYWLNYYMSRYAERAVSMPYIILEMRVSNRQRAAKDDQPYAQNAEEKFPRSPSAQGCLLDIHVTDYNATRAKLVAQGLKCHDDGLISNRSEKIRDDLKSNTLG